MTNDFTLVRCRPSNRILIKIQQEEGGAVPGNSGGVVEGPSSFHRSTLKRSTVPVEFRFELAARLGTVRGSATKEKPDPDASGKGTKERGAREVTGNSRKRAKLGELGVKKKNGIVERGTSGLKERKDDQMASHAGAWKGNASSGSNISSTASMTRSKRKPLIIPEEFRFSTEKRAKERGAFDEGVRMKQEKKKRELDEERAAKAVEEEREVKKMRKMAVPKANAVPEWYAGMPKRKAG